jgi:hypothetical protein
MAPQSLRHSISAPLARRRRPAKFARLRCEHLEDRIAPALFNVQTPFSPGSGVLNNNGCVAVGDLNHDGLTDAVLTNFGTGYGAPYDTGTPGNSITVLYGKAGGGFTPVTIPTGGTNPSFVALADLNGDGWLDAVVVNENSQNNGTVSVFKNDGQGHLSLVGTPFSTSSINPSWVGVADVTGSGVPDIIVGSFGKADATGSTVSGNNITIFQENTDAQGHGNFTFSNGPVTTLAPGVSFIPTSLAIADFNGDGKPDIAAAVPGVPADSGQPQPNGSIYVFQNTGSGAFAAPNQYDSGGALPLNIQAADLNGDGKPDLVVANAGDPSPTATPEFKGNAVGVLLNTSSGGSLSFGVPTSLTANCYGTFAVAVADFNLDGKPDIAAINYGSANSTSPNAFVSVYMGNGNGTFTPGSPATYDTQSNLPGGQYLAVGNFHGNGTPDLIVAQASNKVGLLFNTTAASPQVTGTQVNDGSAQRSRVTSLQVTFSTQVSFATTPGAAFTLIRNSDGAPVMFTATANVVGGVTVVTLNGFSGSATEFGSLADGRYTLTALASQISAGGQALNGGGGVGTNYTFGSAQGLFRLYGDVNGDGVVNGLDLALFRSAFGSAAGDANFLAYLDFTGDGVLNGLDLAQFRTRFGTTLP